MTPPKSTAERIAQLSYAAIYPMYVQKVTTKGRTEEDLLQVITWLTGYTEKQLQKHIDRESNFAEFFAGAKMNPNADKITGVICGYRVEEIEDELEWQARCLDKVIDELARGKKMESILRS